MSCYLKITTESVKERLNKQKGYKNSFCCHKTLNNILNRLGYSLKKVLKCKSLKKIPQTDAIFKNVSFRHNEAKQDKGILRISIERNAALTKAIVKIGELSGTPSQEVDIIVYKHLYKLVTTTNIGIAF